MKKIICLAISVIYIFVFVASYANVKGIASSTLLPQINLGQIRGINYSGVYANSWSPDALNPQRFRYDLTKADFERISSMGFNAIRLWPRTINYFVNDIASNLQENMSVYNQVLSLCRENKLYAQVIIFMEIPENYSVLNSNAQKILDAYSQLVNDYSDVIIGFEIANEPDMNQFGLTTSQMEQKYSESTSDWATKAKPFLKWATDYFKTKGTNKPLSCGFMSAPMYDRFDQDNYDVSNIHNYEEIMDNFIGFINSVKQKDVQILGAERPMLITELAHQGGRLQPASDVMNYCESNYIGYFVWEYGIGYWGDYAGFLDYNYKLRASTLPLNMLLGYQNYYPMEQTGYDITPGGTNTLTGSVDAIKQMVLFRNYSVDSLKYNAQHFVNGVRALVGYYTPDFNSIYNQMPNRNIENLSDEQYKYLYTIYTAASAALPYVRNYGTYQMDNGLGGNQNVKYWDGEENPPTLQLRPKFYFEAGKNDSKAVLLQNRNRLLCDYPISSGKISVSADLAPLNDSEASIVFLAEKNMPAFGFGQGLRISVTKNMSSQAKSMSIYPEEYRLKLSSIDSSGQITVLSQANLSSSDFDSKGYCALKVEYDVATNSMVDVYVGASKKISKNVTISNLSSRGYLGFDCPEYMSMCADNLIVKNISTDTVICSDSFEQGKKDYDRLVYNNSQNDGFISDLKSIITEIISTLKFSNDVGLAPKKVTAFKESNSIQISFEDSSSQKSCNEIQISYDGVKFKPIWRALSNILTVNIPLPNGGTNTPKYRVVAINNDGTYGYCSNVAILNEPLPLAIYEFEDNSAIGKDTSGNNNHLLQKGTGVITQARGVAGMAAHFNGDTVLSALGGKGVADFTDSLNNVTISFWAKRDDDTPNGGRAISSGYYGGHGGFAFKMDTYLENAAYFTPVVGKSSDGSTSGSTWNGSVGDTWWSTVSMDKPKTYVKNWHQYTLSVDNSKGEINFYIDGIKVKTTIVAPGSFVLGYDWHTFTIGGISDGDLWTGELFNGSIDQLKIYSQVLSQENIEDIYIKPISSINLHTQNDNLLSNIQPKTSVANFKESLVVRDDVNLSIEKDNVSLSENIYVGTGTILKTLTGDNSVSYPLIVYGDTNGDGEISVFDLAKMKQKLLKSSTLDGYFAVAADINGDTILSISDLLAVKKHILGVSSIIQR